MKLLILFSFLSGLVFSNPIQLKSNLHSVFINNLVENFESQDKNIRVEMINEYVDLLMEEVRALIIDNGLDPMNLPDFHKRISYKPIIIEHWGNLNLTDGWLQDVSTIARNGDCALQYNDKSLKIVLPVSFQDFVFDYLYSLKIRGFFGPSGGIQGIVKNIQVKAKINVDLIEKKLSLEEFETDSGKITLSFTGHGLVDWMTNIMTKAVTTFFKGILINVLDGILKENLEGAIVKINDVLAEAKPQPLDFVRRNY